MEELIQKINRSLSGQGTNVNADGALAPILTQIVEFITPLIINATSSAQIPGGYNIPRLTAEQVKDCYDAVMAGRKAMVVSEAGNGHFNVLQGDTIGDVFCISYLYYDYALIEYVVNGESVTISYRLLDGTTGDVA